MSSSGTTYGTVHWIEVLYLTPASSTFSPKPHPRSDCTLRLLPRALIPSAATLLTDIKNMIRVLIWTSLLVSGSLAQNLSSTLLGKIRSQMNQASTASWEIGTRLETLTEIDFPSVSVFGSNYIAAAESATNLSSILNIAKEVVNGMTSSQTQLIVDGSAGDPASVGVTVLMGNLTKTTGVDWNDAAEKQLNDLLNLTPRTADGAISHRKEYVQLWSDFIYMVPPLLAYYGVVTSNTTLIDMSYNQIKLYRSYLFDSKQSLWRHVTMANAASDSPEPTGTPSNPDGFNDTGHWSTGNGWAAGGMLRVIATIANSPYAKSYGGKTQDLKNWVGEIHHGMAKNIPSSSIFTNYVDNSSTFPDASGTAMFAATVYRALTLYSPGKYSNAVNAAERARSALYTTGGSAHFDDQGWLQPVVNPNAFSNEGSQSPEAQSFVLQLDNNWNEWKAAGSSSAADRRIPSANALLPLTILSAIVWLLA